MTVSFVSLTQVLVVVEGIESGLLTDGRIDNDLPVKSYALQKLIGQGLPL